MGLFTVQSQTTVQNTGSLMPASYLDNLGAHISGGKALLHRFGVTSEEALLGAYDPTVETTYDYPGRTVDSILDSTYTKIYMKDALIRTFRDLTGVDSTVAPVSNYSNRLRSTTVSFKSNGDDYPRSAVFGGRDVQVGDKVIYGSTISSTRYEISTHVAGFVAEVVAATIGSASAASGNHATQGSSNSFNQTAGAGNWVEGSASIASYDDLDGGIDRVYTIVFTTGGVEADARFNVYSSDGLDDDTDVTPAAFDSPTSIGSKGATVTWTLDNGNTVDDGAPDDQFVVGQTFQLAVHQAFTQPTLASGGTYTGTSDKTYIVTVSTGGPFSSTVAPKVTVSTSIGTGYVAPFVVASSGAAISLGDGVTLTFTGTALNKNDIYYITVTAAAEGAYKTLILKDNMGTTLLTATDGDLEILIPEDSIEITENRVESPPDLNWAQDDSIITLYDGITATASDGSLVDDLGDPMYMPVISGDAYVHYREWDQSDLDVISSLTDPDDVEGTLGPVHPDNPLALGVSLALQNSNSQPVYYTAVSDPSVANTWDDTLSAIEYANGIYKLVPLTFDETVIRAYIDHCEAQSTPENQAWRSTIAAMDVLTTIPIVDSTLTSDGGNALFTISDNPAVSGTQYTRVQCPAGNAKFVTSGVEAGDIVRFAFVVDGFGDSTYDEYTVASVVNEDELILDSGPDVPYAVAQKGEVHRTLSKAEITEDLKARKEALVSSRLVLVLPDELTVEIDGVDTTVAGYHAAAALAGAISCSAPHQPYHYTEISGFTAVPKTTSYFAQAHLRDLSENGFAIVDQDTDGTIFVRKLVTTDVETIDNREEVYVRNLDAIYFILLKKLGKFRGHANVVDEVKNQILFETNMAINAIRFESGRSSELGSMLISGQAKAVRASLVLLDSLVIDVSLNRPYPLNTTTFNLVV